MKLLRPTTLLFLSLITSSLAAETVFNKAVSIGPKTLDPTYGTTAGDIYTLIDIYEGLLTYDREANVVLGQAKELTISEDQLAYTFTLRKDLHWSDGTPITAKDYQTTMNRLLSPEHNAYKKPIYMLQFLENYDDVIAGNLPASEIGMRVIDTHTLEYKLSQPVPFFRYMLINNAYFPIPTHLVELHDEGWAEIENIVSNGAYTPISSENQAVIKMKRNANYRDPENVFFDIANIHVIREGKSAASLLGAGKLDLITKFYMTDNYSWMQDNLGVRVVRPAPATTTYVALNQGYPPLADVRVRQALSLAAFRSTIVSRIWEIDPPPKVAFSFSPPSESAGWAEFTPDWADWTSEQRIETAQELMKEAGYGPDNPMSLEFTYNESTSWRLLANALKLQWARIWVQLEIKSKSGKTHYTDLAQGNYQIARAGWGMLWPDPTATLNILTSTSPKNYGRWYDNEYDKLFEQLMGSTDPKIRIEKIRQLENRIHLDVPIISIAHTNYAHVSLQKIDVGEINVSRYPYSRHARKIE